MERLSADRKKRIKTVLRLLAWLESAAVVVFIYLSSAQDANLSGRLSLKVTEWLLTVFKAGFRGMDAAERQRLIWKLHPYVRKLAHFSEFALLGQATRCLTELYLKRHKTVPVVVFCAVCAAVDELHQIFSNGRVPTVTDTLIDFSGALTGIALVCIAAYLVRKWLRGPVGKEKVH